MRLQYRGHRTRADVARSMNSRKDAKPQRDLVLCVFASLRLGVTLMILCAVNELMVDWWAMSTVRVRLAGFPRRSQNHAVHLRTACTVFEVENQSSVPGDGQRSGSQEVARSKCGV